MRWIGGTRLAILLLVVVALDELAGVAFVGMPDVQSTFDTSTATTTLAVFTVPAILALLVEPWLLLLAARRPHQRKAWVVTGLGVMSLGLILAGAAPTAWMLAGALGLAWLGSGLGTNLSQVVLMDVEPDRRDAWMSRWALAGELGDLGTPLLLAGLGLLTLGWREGFWIVGGLVGVQALILALRPFPASQTPVDDEVPTLAGLLSGALGNPRLLAWLGAAMLCGLLDDAFTGFASLWLQQAFDASLTTRGLVLVAGNIGAVLGLSLSERLVSRGVSARAVLIVSGLVACAALAGWILAPNLWSSALLLGLLAAAVAPLWPLVKARAFDSHQGDAATVEALSSALGLVELSLPFALGLVADTWGLVVALVLLGLQPAGIVVLALVDPGRGRRAQGD